MQLLDDHLWTLYSRGMIAAEEMIDKGKNPADLSDKVHRIGRTVGRTELDMEPDEAEGDGAKG
jgi:twitching motility protein PilT